MDRITGDHIRLPEHLLIPTKHGNDGRSRRPAADAAVYFAITDKSLRDKWPAMQSIGQSQLATHLLHTKQTAMQLGYQTATVKLQHLSGFGRNIGN